MTKRYKILQKKLQELESELEQVFSHPPDNFANFQNNQLYSFDIEKRISFLKSLLTAEVALSPKKPHHLEHIEKRVLDLETAFHDWNETDNFQGRYSMERDSACSCTESCLNDDGGSDSIVEDAEDMFDGLQVEEEERVRVDEDEKENEVTESGKGVEAGFSCKDKGVGKSTFYRGFVGGVVIGMSLMAMVMGGYFSGGRQYSMGVLTPT